jgi:ribosomal protein S18
MSFLKSFQNNSVHSSYPFDHWELTEPLTDQQIREICEAKVPEVKIDFDGTRAFVTKDNYKDYPHLKKFIDELCKMETAKYIGSKIKKDLTKAYVRVEIIADRVGFWLKPHCDIKEKLMSCLLFANPDNYESEELGTDFYDKNLKLVKTVPYKNNYGYVFTSGPDTWHGLEKKEIKRDRRCLQVNYVTFETDWKVN